jgi:hypothetical protein
MTLKQWIINETSDGQGGFWAVYKINSSSILRDTYFGPMPVKVPPEIELTAEERTLQIDGFDECCKWLDFTTTKSGV